MARHGHRRHASPKYEYPGEDVVAAQVNSIQAKWLAITPDTPAALRDPRLPLAVIKNESNVGRQFRTGRSSYMGWFQLSSNANRDTFGRRDVLEATANKVNEIGKTDPEAMKLNGKPVKEWTPQLVAQNFARHPYLQTVGFLECAKYHDKTYKLGLDRFEPQHAAALAYFAHVIPVVAKNIALHPDSKESLAALNSPKVHAMMRRNPSVFAGGKHNPETTLENWANNFYKPMEKRFASLLDGAEKTAEAAKQGVTDFARRNAEAQSAALSPGAKRMDAQTTRQAAVIAPGTKVESTTFSKIAAFLGFGGSDNQPAAPAAAKQAEHKGAIVTQEASAKLTAAAAKPAVQHSAPAVSHIASSAPPPPIPKKPRTALRPLDS